MKLTAYKVIQNNTVLYLTSVPAKDIVNADMFMPDFWNPVTGHGYQREVSLRYAGGIQRYLGGESGTNVMPTPIIVNSRNKLKVTELGNEVVEIELDRIDFPLFIIDGQHRILAARQAIAQGDIDLENYSFPVTITNLSLKDEIIHFRNINGRSNKSPKSLNDILMGKLADDFGIIPTNAQDQATIRASRAVMGLVNDMRSPWYGHVALGGMRRRSHHLVIQSSLTNSLLPMFSTGSFADTTEDPEHEEILFNWWSALAETWPEAFKNPHSYTFMRQRGFIVWHRVLALVLNNLNRDPSREQMIDALQMLRDNAGYDDEWFKVHNYDGAAGYLGSGASTGTRLIDLLWKHLPKEPFERAATPKA